LSGGNLVYEPVFDPPNLGGDSPPGTSDSNQLEDGYLNQNGNSPITIQFSGLTHTASVALLNDEDPFLIEALLNGVPVDSFVTNIGLVGDFGDPVNPQGFFGFQNEPSVFNQLRITELLTPAEAVADDPLLALDNPQFTPIPEPASIIVLGGGLLGMAAYGWRRRVLARRAGLAAA
jgi:hypothetical protein